MKARRMVFPTHYFALLSEKVEIVLILSQKVIQSRISVFFAFRGFYLLSRRNRSNSGFPLEKKTLNSLLSSIEYRVKKSRNFRDFVIFDFVISLNKAKRNNMEKLITNLQQTYCTS